MSRSRINSDHFIAQEPSRKPRNSGGTAKYFPRSKPLIKFHSAINSIGKRDCSGVRPRRLDFDSKKHDRPSKGKLFGQLKFLDLNKQFKSASKHKRNLNPSPMKKEGKLHTPADLEFPLLSISKAPLGTPEPEDSNKLYQTAKKEKPKNLVFNEIHKTKSGRKKKEGIQPHDKRSSSLSSSMILPKTLSFAEKNNKKPPRLSATPQSLIQRWMRNDDIFKGKYLHPVDSPSLPKPKGLFLGRSNSDVCTVYESDAKFNNRMEAENNMGKNKFIPENLNTFKVPAPIVLSHKEIIEQLNAEESKDINRNLKIIIEDNNLSQNGNIKTTKVSKMFNKKNTWNTEVVTNKFDLNSSMEQEEYIDPQYEINDNNPNRFFNENQPNFNLITSIERPRHPKPAPIQIEFNSGILQNDGGMEQEEPLNRGMQLHLQEQQPQMYNTPTQKNRKNFEDIRQKSSMKGDFFEEDFSDLDQSMVQPTLTKQSDSFIELGLAKQIPSYQYPHHNVQQSYNDFQQNQNRFDNDFEVVGTLGAGNFGKVFKCRNKLDGLFYAVKITTKSIQKSNLSFAVNEALALASLNARYDNPNIVRFYNAWYEEDRLHLVMEFCKGSITDLAKEGEKYTESMVRHIVRDICSGLKLIHDMGIVHLDIKPDNILYSLTKKYKLADLGLSRLKLRVRGEDIHEGDVRYMAPELLQEIDSDGNIPDLTKADVFSMGITIFELMTGLELPKNGPQWHSLRNGDDLKKLYKCHFSTSLKNLVAMMMDPSPSKRPSASQILQRHLPSNIELELIMYKKQINILREKNERLEQMLKIKNEGHNVSF